MQCKGEALTQMAALAPSATSMPAWSSPLGEERDDGGGGEKKKRRSRQNFSWSQLSVLERVFETDPLPRQALLLELSNRLDITPRCVQVWFQNRRQKFKAMHQAMGQVPPTLKNASSWLTSLETLLPDLAPEPPHVARGPEPSRVTASQLRESAPKVRRALHICRLSVTHGDLHALPCFVGCAQMLQMQQMHPGVRRNAAASATTVAASENTSTCALSNDCACCTAAVAPGVPPGPLLYRPEDVSMDPTGMAMGAMYPGAHPAAHPAAHMGTPVSREYLQTVTLIGMQITHPVFAVSAPEDDCDDSPYELVQLPNGSLMQVSPDGTGCVYVPHSYMQVPLMHSAAPTAFVPPQAAMPGASAHAWAPLPQILTGVPTEVSPNGRSRRSSEAVDALAMLTGASAPAAASETPSLE